MAKLDLKEIYYTSREENMKTDAKELVANIIVIQKSIERIIQLRKKTGAAKVVFTVVGWIALLIVSTPTMVYWL